MTAGTLKLEQPAGVVDEHQVASQREAFQHAFAGRIQRSPVFDRAEPDRFLQARRCFRPCDAAMLRGLEVIGSALGLHVLDARGNRPISRKAAKAPRISRKGFIQGLNSDIVITRPPAFATSHFCAFATWREILNAWGIASSGTSAFWVSVQRDRAIRRCIRSGRTRTRRPSCRWLCRYRATVRDRAWCSTTRSRQVPSARTCFCS